MLRGFSPQQAVDAPRFCISAGDTEVRAEAAGDINSIVFFEDTFDPDVVAKLQGKSISPYEQ
jgi:gamma-glutamyltranspeptidase/glutathione hydrolase